MRVDSRVGTYNKLLFFSLFFFFFPLVMQNYVKQEIWNYMNDKIKLLKFSNSFFLNVK